MSVSSLVLAVPVVCMIQDFRGGLGGVVAVSMSPVRMAIEPLPSVSWWVLMILGAPLVGAPYQRSWGCGSGRLCPGHGGQVRAPSAGCAPRLATASLHCCPRILTAWKVKPLRVCIEDWYSVT